MLATAVGLFFFGPFLSKCVSYFLFVLGSLVEVAFRRIRNKCKTVCLHKVIFEPGEGIIDLTLLRSGWSNWIRTVLMWVFWALVGSFRWTPRLLLKYTLLPPTPSPHSKNTIGIFYPATFSEKWLWLKNRSVSQIYGVLIRCLLLSHSALPTLMGAGNHSSSSPAHQPSHMWASIGVAAFLWC